MSEKKMFPILTDRETREYKSKPHPSEVPWSIAELAYSAYASKYGKSQTLERLAERGGFWASEMDMLLPDWRERVDERTKLKQRAESAEARVKELEADLSSLRARFEGGVEVWIARGKNATSHLVTIHNDKPSYDENLDSWKGKYGPMCLILESNLRIIQPGQCVKARLVGEG